MVRVGDRREIKKKNPHELLYTKEINVNIKGALFLFPTKCIVSCFACLPMDL